MENCILYNYPTLLYIINVLVVIYKWITANPGQTALPRYELINKISEILSCNFALYIFSLFPLV